MNNLTFTVPAGYSRELVAEILAAYLLGNRAFENTRSASDGRRRHGPFRKETSVDDDHWQLDGGNDFFLRFEGEMATLSHRYDNREKCAALVTLFTVMHPLGKKQLLTSVA